MESENLIAQVKKNIILILISLIVFSSVFTFKYLTELDSVYFYKEAYTDLTQKLNIWGSYDAPFGGLHLILWLYPVTYLAGFVGNLFNLDWNIIVRLFFYIPSIFLSFYSIQRLGKTFNFSSSGKFLMSLIYVFNTYFILLIDGGQLGVLLAYSIFPLAVDSILNLKFFRTVFILTLIGIFDPRFLLMATITGLLLYIFRPQKLEYLNILKLIPVFILVLLINAYWLIPILNVTGSSVTTFVSDLKLTSFLNALFLYQPHWPYNEFGKVTYPNIFFIIIPTLLTLASLLKPTKEKTLWLLMFIFFALLVKGETDPLGNLYSYFLNNITGASAFRDSTKFFAPLIVVYSLIVARFYETELNKKRFLSLLIPVLLLLPLVPGLIYGLNNNLKGTKNADDLIELKNSIESNSFSRTIYIPHKPQLAYQTENNQAIDGRVLTDYLPFATDNYGSEDRFNFMQRDNYINYFRSLGIKNLVYISSKKPEVVEIKNSMPERYYIDRMAVIVGSPMGVENLIPEYGVTFIEDGKTDLGSLLEVSSEKLFFILNNKNIDDLINAGLKDKFMDPSLLSENNWGKYLKEDYLTWKYQLLIRSIDTKEINFNSGIILSTQENEAVRVKYDFKNNTKYKIFIRSIAGKDSKGVSVNGKQFNIPQGNTFKWLSQDVTFEHDTDSVVLTNKGGFNAIGGILIIEADSYQNYYDDIKNKLNSYNILNINSRLPVSKISFEPKNGWLILNQSYNESWKVGELAPFAINSITNGFAVEEGDLNTEISFIGQEILDQSVKISLASVLVFVVSYLGYTTYGYFQKRQKNN